MEINGRKVKQVMYFWFDHCLLRGTGIEKHITEAIEKHDWIQFRTYQEMLNNMVSDGQNNEKWIYLPNHVHVEYEDGEYARFDMTEELFNEIEFSEYECG